MSDPISGGAAKVAAEMLKEVQSAAQQVEQAQQAQAPQNLQFNNVLSAQQVQEVGEVTGTRGSADVLRAATAAQRTGAPPVPAVGSSIDVHPLRNGLERVMKDVMRGQNKLEEITNLALSGREFSSSELLALQAGVYRFTQELELTSKVIEKGTASIKQTLNTQV